MKKTHHLLLLFAMLLIIGCREKDSNDQFGVSNENGLSSSVSTLSLLTGGTGKSVISGGTEPYSVTENTNSAAVSSQLSGRELQLTGLAEGSSSVKVKDASSPSKSIVITVTVKNYYTASSAGIVSFTSDRGNFSVNGIAEYGLHPPLSGSGAMGLQDFESLSIFAYSVNSATDVDMTFIDFMSNTSNYAGTYYYPASGKQVNISYYPHCNPNDSLFLQTGYLLDTYETATIDSITSTKMKGTFSGKGRYYLHDTVNVNQKIDATNGLFNVPIIHTGSMEGIYGEQNIIRLAKKILFRARMKK